MVNRFILIFREIIRPWKVFLLFLLFYFYCFSISPYFYQGSIYLITATGAALKSMNAYIFLPMVIFLLFGDIVLLEKDKEYLRNIPYGRLKMFLSRLYIALILFLVLLIISIIIVIIERFIFDIVPPDREFIQLVLEENLIKPFIYLLPSLLLLFYLSLTVSGEVVTFILFLVLWYALMSNFLIFLCLFILLAILKLLQTGLFDKIKTTWSSICWIICAILIVFGGSIGKNLRMERAVMGFWVFETVYPLILSISIAGIFNEVRDVNLMEVIAKIPMGILTIFKSEVKKNFLAWLTALCLLLIFFRWLFIMNPILYPFTYLSNLLFFSGILVLNESLTGRPIIGLIFVILISAFWILPDIQSSIGWFGVYRFINPFYLTFHHQEGAWVTPKTSLLLIGLLFYITGYLFLKRNKFLYTRYMRYV